MRFLARPPHDGRPGQTRKLKDGTLRYRCVWCWKVCSGRRTRWCSQACVDEYLIRKRGGHARAAVRKRDGGVCQLCGFECKRMERILRRLSQNLWGRPYAKSWWRRKERIREDLLRRGYDREGVMGRKSLWQADHVVPVVEGGGACGVENLRTLCTPCHKKETRELAARRARRRREG